MEFKGKIAGTLSRLLYLYFEVINKIFRSSLRLKGDSSGISISIESPPSYKASLDERIARIDAARSNLLEGLQAIDELKLAAQENKKELEDALAKLRVLEKNKASAEEELGQIRRIASADIETFQKMAGVPSASKVKRERVVGFISGVLASIIASGIIFGVSYALG